MASTTTLGLLFAYILGLFANRYGCLRLAVIVNIAVAVRLCLLDILFISNVVVQNSPATRTRIACCITWLQPL